MLRSVKPYPCACIIARVKGQATEALLVDLVNLFVNYQQTMMRNGVKRFICFLFWVITSTDGYLTLPDRSTRRFGASGESFLSGRPHSLRIALAMASTAEDGESRNSNDADKIEFARGIKEQKQKNGGGLGGYDPFEDLRGSEIDVGDPQIKLKEKERSVTSILAELAAIQQQGPQKYCILGSRHCSYLHQQIIELLYVPFDSLLYCYSSSDSHFSSTEPTHWSCPEIMSIHPVQEEPMPLQSRAPCERNGLIY